MDPKTTIAVVMPDGTPLCPEGGTCFVVTNVPRIGETICVKDRFHRISDVVHEVDHPQGCIVSLLVGPDSGSWPGERS